MTAQELFDLAVESYCIASWEHNTTKQSVARARLRCFYRSDSDFQTALANLDKQIEECEQ